jgi:hypothetical protein
VPDGFQVDPLTLRGASRDVYAGSDAVGDAATVLSRAQLVAATLGEVPAADELARAFATFVGEHGDDLRRGSVWVADSGDGLVSSAEDYERRDDAAANGVTAAGDMPSSSEATA